MDIVGRITKDIALFSENLKKIDAVKMEKEKAKVVELAKMYAKDADSFLLKEDYYTSFSCISYAHGLLDAILKLDED